MGAYKMRNQKSGLMKAALAGVVAAGAAGLIFSATAKAQTGAGSANTGNMVKCHGINSCKGTGACGGKNKDGSTHSCAGMNHCKGQGWIKTTKKECEEKGGKATAY